MTVKFLHNALVTRPAAENYGIDITADAGAIARDFSRPSVAPTVSRFNGKGK